MLKNCLIVKIDMQNKVHLHVALGKLSKKELGLAFGAGEAIKDKATFGRASLLLRSSKVVVECVQKHAMFKFIWG